MTEKVCLGCNTKNPSHFEYCKHCGAPLPAVDKLPKDEPEVTELPSFGELTYREYQRFIGKNAESVLHDFHSLESRRVVFCLPVLFLGLFFGFFGMSVWFFYRKLKKMGTVLLLVGLLFVIIEGVLNASLNKTFFESFMSIAQSNLDENTMADTFSQLFSYYSYSLVSFTGYIEFFAAFYLSAIALRIYKKDSYERALALKQKCLADTRFPLDILLKLHGGTSGSLCSLPILAGIFASPIAFLVTLI